MNKPALRRSLAALFSLWFAVGAAAQIQFLGVMSDPKKTVFAVRADAASTTRWVSLGDTVGDFVATAYDAEREVLTLRHGAASLVLRLPDSHVEMATDEIVVGLQQILHQPGAETMRELLHPALRRLFKDADLDSAAFRAMLVPGSSVEIMPLTEEMNQAFDSRLTAVERAVGSRPTHGLWIKTNKGGSMAFVVRVGDGWFLAPGVPPKE